jgi:hypothetical protein
MMDDKSSPGSPAYGRNRAHKPGLVYANSPLYVYITPDNRSEIQRILESSNLVKYQLEKNAKNFKGVKIKRFRILGKNLTVEYDNDENSMFRGKAYKGIIGRLSKYAI